MLAERAGMAGLRHGEPAQSSGTSPNQAKAERQGGMGPARGNGSSSSAAERPAAAQIFQGWRIQGRVYRMGRVGAGETAENTLQSAIWFWLLMQCACL